MTGPGGNVTEKKGRRRSASALRLTHFHVKRKVLGAKVAFREVGRGPSKMTYVYNGMRVK